MADYGNIGYSFVMVRASYFKANTDYHESVLAMGHLWEGCGGDGPTWKQSPKETTLRDFGYTTTKSEYIQFKKDVINIQLTPFGTGSGGACSAIEWIIEMEGEYDTFLDYLPELFEMARKHEPDGKDIMPEACFITVWAFTGGIDYYGEYDCDHWLVGELTSKHIQEIGKAVEKENEPQ